MGEGSTIMDLEDFIVASNNILPLGSLVFLMFCTEDMDGDLIISERRQIQEKGLLFLLGQEYISVIFFPLLY